VASCVTFICEKCGKNVESWDDGNPYWIDEKGEKHYAYHPDRERSRCIGNDSPHLCLSCGKECMVDSRAPITSCPNCQAESLVDNYELGGKPCPFCKDGKFSDDPLPTAIS
jgi:DNA-directed RNA polymerase subunit RPC12/RpoP